MRNIFGIVGLFLFAWVVTIKGDYTKFAFTQNFGSSYALLSALVFGLLFYCSTLAFFLCFQPQTFYARFVAVIAGAALPTGVLGLNFGATYLMAVGAIALISQVSITNMSLDAEVEKRRAQILREFGLSGDQNLPVWALLILQIFILIVVVAWSRLA